MLPASCTPEGSSAECPICGKWACVLPAAYPTSDVPCPHCGYLLWFEQITDELFSQRSEATLTPVCLPAAEVEPFNNEHSSAAFGAPVNNTLAIDNAVINNAVIDSGPLPWPPRPAPQRKRLRRGFDLGDRLIWLAVAVISTGFVALHDGPAVSTYAWFVDMLVLGQVVVPLAYYGAQRVRSPFTLSVALAWAVWPGPIAGALLGTLIPLVESTALTSYHGGVIGVVVGPVIAALLGVPLMLTADVALWALTGATLRQRLRWTS